LEAQAIATAEVVEQETLKRVGDYLEKHKKWIEELPSISVGTPQSTGGIRFLCEPYYLIAKSYIESLKQGKE
jgi:hypothetical protein